MGPSDLATERPPLGVQGSPGVTLVPGVQKGVKETPISFDVAAFSRIIQQMTKLYPFNPAAVAASVSSLGSTGHLPLAFNGTFTEDDDAKSTEEDSEVLDLSQVKTSKPNRVHLSSVKHKVIEDVWVENDKPLSWASSKVAAYNPAQKLFMCGDCECVGFLSRVAEHWLGAHANLRVFHCPRCPYTSAWSRCVKMHLTRQHHEQFADTSLWKENTALLQVTGLMQELRTKVETKIDAASALTDKRFYCPHCPYATDRRDLYTRHENIHKDNKPFHCYVCLKQFNRADHVKKHFIRMHADSEYDITKIRKPQEQNKRVESVPIEKEVYIKKPLSPIPIIENIKTESTNKILQNQIKSEILIQVQPNQDHINQNNSINQYDSKPKRKGDRAYTCHYCNWSGTDNWCLKRHMNTHIKPFGCIMCDYKAARAERLSTHVWKVHNKRICNKCNFLADTQERLVEHTREEHHNNPYSRRHLCASCGMSFDTRANLETHLHLKHTRPSSPEDTVQITPIPSRDMTLVAPIDSRGAKCPHCQIFLTKDVPLGDHWLVHHDDVCGACVAVFTAVYGPRLWKKVKTNNTRVPPIPSLKYQDQIQDQIHNSLNVIVNGLNKRKLDYINEYELVELPNTKHARPNSPILKSKRPRKQSRPQKIIIESETSRKMVKMTKRSLVVRCVHCKNKPKFENLIKLKTHQKLRHTNQKRQKIKRKLKDKKNVSKN